MLEICLTMIEVKHEEKLEFQIELENFLFLRYGF